MQQLCNGLGRGTVPRRQPINTEARSLPGSRSHVYLKRQAQRESNARSYPRRIPVAIREAKGIFVTDVDGNVYFDCLAGAGGVILAADAWVQEIRRITRDRDIPLIRAY